MAEMVLGTCQNDEEEENEEEEGDGEGRELQQKEVSSQSARVVSKTTLLDDDETPMAVFARFASADPVDEDVEDSLVTEKIRLLQEENVRLRQTLGTLPASLPVSVQSSSLPPSVSDPAGNSLSQARRSARIARRRASRLRQSAPRTTTASVSSPIGSLAPRKRQRSARKRTQRYALGALVGIVERLLAIAHVRDNRERCFSYTPLGFRAAASH